MAKELLAIYLRLIDAAAADASLKEVGQVLFPEVDNDPPHFNRDKLVVILAETAVKLRNDPLKVLAEMGVEADEKCI